MKTKQVKTSELAGVALDWAVAECEGYITNIKPDDVVYVHQRGEWHHNGNWQPSCKWNQGGPIIEQNKINIAHVGRSLNDAIAPHEDCYAAHIDGMWCQYAKTHLEAAMRCYVASKLGGVVDVPENLI